MYGDAKRLCNPYRYDGATSWINDSYLFVFARCRNQAAVKIPRHREDGVRMYGNDTETLGSRRVPYNTLHTTETTVCSQNTHIITHTC